MPALPLKGRYQCDNASGVLALVDWLSDQRPVAQDKMRAGLKKTRHAGRMQQVSWQGQHWLLDVAHNPHAAAALTQALSSSAEVVPHCVCVLAVMADKDVGGMIRALAPVVRHWVLPPLSVERALSPEALANQLKEAGMAANRIHVSDSMAHALETGRMLAQDESMQAVVCGSFYTVAEALPVMDVSVNESEAVV
jgi:dihydrofolate synthase/folylpolyglutamate synthase